MKILIPYGLTANDSLIHIDDYTKGEDEAFCVACGQVLVARQGKVRQWHFAHYSGHCTVSRETELHEVSKHIIQKTFQESRADGSEYRIHWQCSGCRIWSDTDIAALANKVSVEYEPVQGIRSDLFFHEGKRDFAIEIVVTHALEDTTRAIYKENKIPVFIVQPHSDTLRDLEERIETTRVYNATNKNCTGCRLQREKKERKQKDRETVRRRLRRLKPVERPMVTWDRDARKNALYPHVVRKLSAYGRKLLKAGFTQSKKKPWIFILKLRGKGVLFANMGGTDVVPIWKDTTPLIHFQLKGCAEDEKKMIVNEVMYYCAEKDIPTRLSFYDSHMYEQGYEDEDY